MPWGDGSILSENRKWFPFFSCSVVAESPQSDTLGILCRSRMKCNFEFNMEAFGCYLGFFTSFNSYYTDISLLLITWKHPVCFIFDIMSLNFGGGSKLAGNSPFVRETRASLSAYRSLVTRARAKRICPCSSLKFSANFQSSISLSAHLTTLGLSCNPNSSCVPIRPPSH